MASQLADFAINVTKTTFEQNFRMTTIIIIDFQVDCTMEESGNNPQLALFCEPILSLQIY